MEDTQTAKLSAVGADRMQYHMDIDQQTGAMKDVVMALDELIIDVGGQQLQDEEQKNPASIEPVPTLQDVLIQTGPRLHETRAMLLERIERLRSMLF